MDWRHVVNFDSVGFDRVSKVSLLRDSDSPDNENVILFWQNTDYIDAMFLESFVHFNDQRTT